MRGRAMHDPVRYETDPGYRAKVETGRRGGRARTAAKKRASRCNLVAARAARCCERGRDPELVAAYDAEQEIRRRIGAPPVGWSRWLAEVRVREELAAGDSFVIE